MNDLERHCRNLEGELDMVKKEIVKILSERSRCAKENESLKQFADSFRQLQEENQSLRKQVTEHQQKVTDSVANKDSNSNVKPCDRSSPDGQECDPAVSPSIVTSKDKTLIF